MAIPRAAHSCHLAVIVMVKSNPAMSSVADQIITFRGPWSRISPPANGATSPNSAMRSPSGPESSPMDQPRSAEIGASRTPGIDMAAAETTPSRKVSATMSQP